MKKAILYRLGGLGDILILTPVAKELKKRGYEVHGCLGSPTGDPKKLLGNLGLFDKIIEYGKLGPMQMDVAKINETDWAGIDFIKPEYDLVVDYKFSIELNSHYKHLSMAPGKEWYVSQNSNYQNWVDVMFSWAGIDPESIPREDKIPMYKVEPEEKAWADRLLHYGESKHIFAIQTNASSLVRTWYHPDRLPKALIAEYADAEIVIWDGGQWIHFKRGRTIPVQLPKDMDPIRASAALVGSSTMFIGADSGFSHIAEALNVKSLTIYTTVPGWTRNKYYKYGKAIEPVGDTFGGVQCRPCFVLDRYCPRVREAALEQFSEREKRIKKAMDTGEQPNDVAVELNTTPNGLMMEANLLQQRYNALIEQQAPCTMTITTERLMDEIRSMICE